MATEILRPNAAGDSTQLSRFPVSGANWDKVDEESADDDTTYVRIASFSYARDLYNLPAHSGSGVINFIKVYFRCGGNSNSAPRAKPALKSNSTVTDGTEVFLPVGSYTTFSEQWNTNPADSAAWEWADIDALQIGVSLKTLNAGYVVKCTQVYVEVDYTTGSVVVTPPTLALALTLYAPTVTAEGNVVVTPPTLALALTLFTPTIGIEGNVVVTPPTLALALTLYAPTVTAGRLSATLQAKQQETSYKPIVSFVFTHGATSYTYDTDRFLRVEHSEEPSSHKAEITLDNSDGNLTSKNLKGYKVAPKWGMVTSAGNETSETAPLWVRDQRLDSVPGKLICSLTCIGIPDRLAEDKANDNYSHQWASTKTVKALITEILDGQPVSDTWGEKQDIYDSYCTLNQANNKGLVGQKLPNPNRTITALSFWLRKTGSPTGDITFKIIKVSTEDVLASGTYPAASVGTIAAWHTVTFGTPVAATVPVYVYCQHTVGDDNNYIQVGFSSTDAKSGENLFYVPWTGSLTEISDQDCAYRYYYQYAGISVYDHCAVWDVIYDSEDSLIDSYIPADTLFIAEGESRLDVIDKLLHYTGCERMFKADGKVHILVPTISGATWVANTAYVVNDYVQPTTPNNNFAYRCTIAGTSHATTEPTWPTTAGGTVGDGTVTWTAVAFDYEYALTTGHTFFGKAIREALVIPNRIVVKSFEADTDQYAGSATSATSYASMRISGKPIRTKLTSNAQATSIAQAYISRLEVASQRGSATVPINVGAEIWNYVKVTDERQSDYRIGNIGYLTRVYIPGSMPRMTFGFGGVPVKGVPGTQLSILWDTLRQLQVEEQLEVERQLEEVIRTGVARDIGSVVRWGRILPTLLRTARAIDEIQEALAALPDPDKALILKTDMDGGGYEIKNIKNPTTDQSAATKGYVDGKL